MKRFLLFIILFLSYFARAQQPNSTLGNTFSATGAFTTIPQGNSGVAFHRLQWGPAGTVSTCQIKLEQSADGVSWSDLITAQTCTTAGRSAIVNGNNNFVRMNLTTFSGGGTVTVLYSGFISAPSESGLALSQPAQSTIATYRTATNWTPTATAATDIFTVTGSATTVVRVNHIGISCTATAAVATDVILQLRSTADTGGSSSSAPLNRLDPNDPAPTATVLAYTANPTPGALVGPISDDKASITTATGAPQFYFEDFGIRNGKPVVLRGTGSVLAIGLNGASITGVACAAEVELTESAN